MDGVNCKKNCSRDVIDLKVRVTGREEKMIDLNFGLLIQKLDI